jgi:MYXO-CTERM domain-containing protein
MPHQLCIGSIDCTGGWSPPDAAPSLVDAVFGSCGAGETCTQGSCQTTHVCVPDGSSGTAGASSSDPIEVDQGCGCRVGSRRSRSVAGLGLVGALALAFARRRTRRS